MIDPEDIANLISPGLLIQSSINYTQYTILSVTNTGVQVQLKNEGKAYLIFFKDI